MVNAVNRGQIGTQRQVRQSAGSNPACGTFPNRLKFLTDKNNNMKVLIAKQNQEIIKDIFPKAEFQESTKNTCTFEVTKWGFDRIYQKVKDMGYNPYALMSW